MKRRIFNLLAAVSLLLCIATVGLWVRSYWVWDLTGWQSGKAFVTVGAGGGRCVYDVAYGTPIGPQARRIEFLGVSYTRWAAAGWHLEVRFALIAVLLGILPSLWVATRRRARPDAVCPTCGYDLRATPERCPECGTLANKPETVKT